MDGVIIIIIVYIIIIIIIIIIICSISSSIFIIISSSIMLDPNIERLEVVPHIIISLKKTGSRIHCQSFPLSHRKREIQKKLQK